MTTEEIAIETKENQPALSQQTTDYVTSVVKAALGAVPFAGSLLVEIAGTIIPNQRTERIVAGCPTLRGFEGWDSTNQNPLGS